MYVIYALCDPDAIDRVYYIGQSMNLDSRFREHLLDKANSPKCQWIRGLASKNRVPYCKVIEEVQTLDEAKERESYWIHYYRRTGMPLTNSSIPPVTDHYYRLLNAIDRKRNGEAPGLDILYDKYVPYIWYSNEDMAELYDQFHEER